VRLERLWTHILINVYVPILLLHVISYLTHYFSPTIFYSRVLANLKILLVTTILFKQVADMLPKSSAMKLVDVWLLFCILIVITTVLLHTIIDQFTEEDHTKFIIRIKKILSCDIFGTKAIVTPVAEVIEEIEGDEEAISKEQKSISNAEHWPLYQYLVCSARAMVFGTLVVFNIIYWSIAANKPEFHSPDI
ncbi:unnamed protein product, partial [Meganyctiphanes norvegica]